MMLELCYCLRGEIRSATSSLTSVPKPLKLLGASYGDLKSLYQELESQVSVCVCVCVCVCACVCVCVCTVFTSVTRYQ